MRKLIQYLIENPNLIMLLKEKKISLVGVSALEQQAIIDAFHEPMHFRGVMWRGEVE